MPELPNSSKPVRVRSVRTLGKRDVRFAAKQPLRRCERLRGRHRQCLASVGLKELGKTAADVSVLQELIGGGVLRLVLSARACSVDMKNGRGNAELALLEVTAYS